MKWKVVAAALLVALVVAFVAVSNLGFGSQLAWKRAKDANTIAAFNQFCSSYPKSSHIAEASTRILNLREADSWRAAKEMGTLAAVDGFLASFANGPHHAEATEMRATLQKEHDLVGESRWASAKQARNLDEIKALLLEYPQASFAIEAKRLLDDLTWGASQQSNTVQSYQEYLHAFPQGAHAAEAKAQIEQVTWNIAQTKDTPVAYEDYIRTYPSGKFVSHAKQQIEDLAWQSAVATKSVAEIQKFITQYPVTAHKAEADRLIVVLQNQKVIEDFKADDVDAIKKLDDGTLNKRIQDLTGGTPLLLAVDTQAVHVAAYLLDKGADPNQPGADESTPLHVAARVGSVPLAQLLLDRKADVDSTIKPQMSVIAIGEKGQMTEKTPKPTALKGTPLHWAAYYDHPEMASLLLKHGANVNADDGYGTRPIHYAARSGDLNLVGILEKAGATWKDVKGQSDYSPTPPTPLHYAKTVEIAKHFLAEGAAIDTNSVMGQPIHAASALGHIDAIRFFLDQGAAVDAKCNWEVGALSSVEATPLWIAASAGNKDIIELLSSKGGNLRFESASGGSLLHAAAMNGQVDVIRYLVQKGLPVDDKAVFPNAFPMVAGWKSITPLGVAVHYGQLSAVQALLDAKADVNAEFGDGWNALSVGFIGRNAEMVALLLQNGATLTTRDTDIDTRNTSDEIKAMLKSHFNKK